MRPGYGQRALWQAACGHPILCYHLSSLPPTMQEWWTTSMNYTLKKGTRRWQSWMTDADDVGGYVTQYSPPGGTFTFTTVRGAGHMVRGAEAGVG